MFIRQNSKKFGNKRLGGHICPPPSGIGLMKKKINEDGLALVLVIPDPGRALVLLGLDVGNAGIVVDGGVVKLWGSNSSTRMEFLVGKYI